MATLSEKIKVVSTTVGPANLAQYLEGRIAFAASAVQNAIRSEEITVSITNTPITVNSTNISGGITANANISTGIIAENATVSKCE